MKKILVLNGPNLNLLGMREPALYGTITYEELIQKIIAFGLEHGARVVCKQSNHEGALVDEIQHSYGSFDGIVLNPGAYTHTSIAIPDALRAVGIPTAEVHITDVDAREPYRRVNYVRDACVLTVAGRGTDGYLYALEQLLSYLSVQTGEAL